MLLKDYLLNLNIFEPPSNSNEQQDEQQRHANIISTRIYLFVLILNLVCLGLISWMNIEIITITVKNPTEQEFHDLADIADCYCSHISLSYGDFTSLQPVFHQVCTSDFISDRWIYAIFSDWKTTYFSYKDFRTFGNAQFQALAALCRLSKDYVQQSIISFYQKQFISAQALSKYNHYIQARLAIDQFQETLPKTFKSQLDLIQQIITSNKLVSAMQTNYMIVSGFTVPIIQPVSYQRNDGTLCDCLLDLNCTTNAVLDDTFGAPTHYVQGNITILPGISSGCLPISSILASTLECFYNQTCLDHLISFFPTNERFSAMPLANTSRFGIYTTVNSIVDSLMIEDWITEISHKKYYDQCAPDLCTYSKESHSNLLTVFTQLVSVLSGLAVLLELIIPSLVRFVRRKFHREETATVATNIDSNQFKISLRTMMIELNIFKYGQNNRRQVRYQRYATRLYIILIIIIVGCVTQYKLISTMVRTQVILNPSIDQYIQLEKLYSSSLICACSSISTPYSTFISVQPHYHQLCSSYLISPQWIAYSNSMFKDAFYILDYRLHASNQFQTLKILCEHAQNIINDALDSFLRSEIVNSQVVARQHFESEMNSLITDWQSRTLGQFLRTINLIRVTTLANQLMNRLNIFFQFNVDNAPIITEPRTYSDCNCAFSATCHNTMKIFTFNQFGDAYEIYQIPNFFLGCYLLDSLLLSKLECFYNQSCLLQINQFHSFSPVESFTFPVLNSKFNNPYETIQSIIDRLMVDSWSRNVNFSLYYNMCQPSSCKYEYNDRDDLFNSLTIIMGIFGGLSIGLKIIIFLGLQLTEKLIKKFSFRVSLLSIKNLVMYNDEQKMIRCLHLILVIIIILFLYFWSAFSSHVITIKVERPSIVVYHDLAKTYASSLQCLCSEISIQYQSFLTITPSFHPVCSRNFIDELWAAYLTVHSDFYQNVSIDYRYSGAAQLQTITSICKLSQDTTYESLSQLLNSHMINKQLLTPSALYRQIQMTIDNVKITMPNLFTNLFSLIREMTTVNMLMTTFGSNWIFARQYNVTVGNTLHTVPVSYGECICGLSSKCSMNLYGVTLGCYTIEALLQSSFECLYDQECVDKTHTYPPLNASVNPSRFPINSTVESIVNQLMIETLSTNLSYESYFYRCAPANCAYSYVENSNLFEGISMLLSLYGGVMMICQLLAVISVKLLRYRSRNTVQAINISTN